MKDAEKTIRYLFETKSSGCHPSAPSLISGCAFTAETLKMHCSVCGKEAEFTPLKSSKDGSFPSYFEALIDPKTGVMDIKTHFREGVDISN